MNCLAVFAGWWMLTAVGIAGPLGRSESSLEISGPQDASVRSGDTVTLEVTVTGMEPISYRWFFNQTNALPATGPSLAITNVTSFHGGLYHVVASNAQGSVTSRLAALNVDEELTFRLLALRTNGFIVIEHESLTGDDRGALAVSSSHVFYTGDNATIRWNRETLTAPADIGRFSDCLVSDLRTETLYALGSGNAELNFGGTITSLIELNPDGSPTGGRIDLSRPIPAINSFPDVGIFSGYGRIVIHNGTNVFSIALPSGLVTDFGPTPFLNNSGTESWAFWGIAEYFGNTLNLVYVDGTTFPRRDIVRYNTATRTRTPVARFTNLADMAVIAFSPSLGRWFFHMEGSSQFRTGFGEVLGSAKALFTTDPGHPAVIREPLSQTNYPGSNVTFSVVAAGTPPLSYQWFFNGAALDGAVHDTLSLAGIGPEAAGQYTVEVRNDAGVALSAPATLTVFTNPIVRSGPLNRTVYPGQTAVFSVVVDGAPPLSYQWLFNGTPLPEAAATNRILILTNVAPEQAGQYSLRVTNIWGQALSANATLTVITVPFIVAEPNPQADHVGSNVVFSVTADGAPPLFYQWRHDGNPLPGATNATLMLTNIQPADAGNYSVVVSNRFGTVTSIDAPLTVLTDAEDQGIFQITSLLTSGVKIVDHNALTSDDRGGIAVSRDHVFITGDFRTARYTHDLTGGTAIGTQPIDSMVTDLRTETVYLLGNGTNVISGGTMTSLIEMNSAGQPTTRVIRLSRSIPLSSAQGDQTGIFAGYGRVVIYNGERVFNILVPSGLVQDLGVLFIPQHQFTESWAFWGVAEHVRNTIYLVYVQDPRTIVRTRVPDGTVSTIATFQSLGDMASIVVSPSRRRWYFHYEGGAQFGGTFETLGYCDATFNIRSGGGLDRFQWGPIGPVQTVNTPFTVTLSALNHSNQVVTNFSGVVALSGLASPGGTRINVTPTLISNFVNGVWTGEVTVSQATPGMVLRADDQTSITADSSVFSVNFANDLVLVAGDAPDPVVLGDVLTYTILVTNIGPNPATSVTLTNTLATNLVFASATSTHGACTNEGNLVRCQLGDLPGGTGATIVVQTRPASVGATVSQVTVSRGEADPSPGNNSATLQTLVIFPSLTVSDASIVEADEGTNDLSFVITLEPASTNTARVNIATANGSATAVGSTADYVSRSATLVFPPGVTTQVFTVRVRGDRFYEADENFFVNLSGAVNAVVADSQGVATIVNDDPQPNVSITDVTVTEGNSGTNNAVFRVGLSHGSGLPVVINFATSNGTATAGSDFNGRSGTVTFTAGTLQLTQNLSIQVLGDVVPERHETFFVNLTGATNAIIVKGQGAGEIRNDDGIGELNYFEWSAIVSPQRPDEPIPVTITARDVIGNLISNFNSTVALSALVPMLQGSNTILGSFTNVNTFGGEFTLGYSFTPSNELRVTHVRHMFGSKVSIWTDDGTLLTSTPVVSSPGFWTTTALSNEVVLSPGATYRVAAFAGDGAYFWTFDGSTNFPHGTIVESHNGSGDVFPTETDSARWWLVDLVYHPVTRVNQPVTPSMSGAFSNGVWNGAVTFSQGASDVQFEARSGQIAGLSEPVDFVLPTDANVALRIGGTNFVHTGSNIVLTITVTNRGPEPATMLALTTGFPTDFSFVSATSSQGTCGNTDSNVVCDLGTLAARGGATVSIVLRAGPTGRATLTATGRAAENDPFPVNNTARLAVTVYLDSDSDGIWDDWEASNGLNAHDSADAPLDPDGDGHTNLEEFQAGTDPRDANSVKLLTRLLVEDTEVRIGLRGAVGNTYRVERSDHLVNWTVVSDVTLMESRDIELRDVRGNARFYRARRL